MESKEEPVMKSPENSEKIFSREEIARILKESIVLVEYLKKNGALPEDTEL